jgi:hypothetical protein
MDDQRTERDDGGLDPVRQDPHKPGRRLNEHLHRLELVSYSVLLIVGVTQIILREQFPQLKVPWPWIGGGMIIALVMYVAISTIIEVKRIMGR